MSAWWTVFLYATLSTFRVHDLYTKIYRNIENKWANNAAWRASLTITSWDGRKWFQTNTLSRHNAIWRITFLFMIAKPPQPNSHSLEHKLWTELTRTGATLMWGSVNSPGHYRAAATSQQPSDKDSQATRSERARQDLWFAEYIRSLELWVIQD